MKDLLEIGDIAPDFSLIGTDGLIYTLNQYRGYRGIVLFFTSEKCLYAKALEGYLRGIALELYKRGIAFLAINSDTDPGAYEEMCAHQEESKLPWCYLHDLTQGVLRKYGALVTPEFFLLDQHRVLVYRGRAVSHPLRPEESDREDLKEAILELLDLSPIMVAETESIGSPILQELLV